MREIGLSDVRLASPPCFPLSWETDNVSVHLSADYPVIWHQCHSLSQHNTPLGPLVLAWAIYGLSSSPNCKNTLSSLFHRLLSISIPILLSAVLFCERDNFWKAYCIRTKNTFELQQNHSICFYAEHNEWHHFLCMCGLCFCVLKNTFWGIRLKPMQYSCTREKHKPSLIDRKL